MEVIKLTYISHGYNLAIFNKPLISHQVEAWKYGPVIPSLYHTLKRFGGNDIDGLQFIDRTNETSSMFLKEEYKELLDSGSETLELLEVTWNLYKNLSGSQLSNLTHKPNTPWDKTWNVNKGHTFSGAQISNDSIKSHYRDKLRDVE